MQQLLARPTLAASSVELPTGVALTYLEQGSPAGVPVLLLHGLSDSMRSFEPMLAHLPASIRAFALSQRGHGDSGRPAGYRPSDFAADLVAFMETVGLERAVVVGHSMGSSIARRFALDYPECLLGLVLVGSFVDLEGNPAATEFAKVVAGLEDPIDPNFVAEFQRSTLARPVPEGFFDQVVRESLKVPARVWKGVVAGLMGPARPAELGAIRVPTLVVWGDQDQFCPRSDQDALVAAIPNSRLLVYAGAGHAPHWEEPARFAADLATFVGELA